MANKTDNLATYGTEPGFAVHKKVVVGPQSPIVGIFGTEATSKCLATCTPLGFNESTGQYGEWVAPDPTVVVLNEDGVITVDGQDTGTIDVSAATEATVTAELLALGINASVVEVADVFTVTFDGEAQVNVAPTVTVTGATNTVTAGTSTFGLHRIQGIVYPNVAQLDDADTVQGNVMTDGEVSFDEIEAVIDAGDVAACKAACKSQTLATGLKVHDIPNIHKEVI